MDWQCRWAGGRYARVRLQSGLVRVDRHAQVQGSRLKRSGGGGRKAVSALKLATGSACGGRTSRFYWFWGVWGEFRDPFRVKQAKNAKELILLVLGAVLGETPADQI